VIVVVELEERDAARLRVLAELMNTSPDVAARAVLVARLEALVVTLAEVLDSEESDAH